MVVLDQYSGGASVLACDLQKKPARQCPVGCTSPALRQNIPARQGAQSVSFWSMVLLLKVPAGQGCSVGYLVPGGQ